MGRMNPEMSNNTGILAIAAGVAWAVFYIQAWYMSRKGRK